MQNMFIHTPITTLGSFRIVYTTHFPAFHLMSAKFVPCIGNEYFNKLDRYSLLLVFLNLTTWVFLNLTTWVFLNLTTWVFLNLTTWVFLNLTTWVFLNLTTWVFLNLTDNFSLLFCCFNSFRIITLHHLQLEGGGEGGRKRGREEWGGRGGGGGGEGERWREEGETTELATVSCTLAELILLTLLLSSESLSFSVRD